MGYDLHIVRRNDWENFEEESNISLEEWLAYVQTDKELQLSYGYQIKVPGMPGLVQNAPGFCDWLGHSKNIGDNNPWFDYWRGQISSKNPDYETIKKMITIAEKLAGKVQGDDGEFYDEAFLRKNQKKPWWKIW